MGAKVFGIITLAVAAGIVGDILRNPGGTTAGANGIATILKPIFNTSLGYKS